MKIKIIVSICLALTLVPFIDAKNVSSTIESVTVYQNSAKITRQAKTNVNGNNEIILEGLTSNLLQSSIQVNVRGNATLLSATFQRNYLESEKKNVKIRTLQDSLEIIQDMVDQTNKKQEVYTLEEEVIKKNNTLGSEEESMSVDALVKLADFYRNRLLEIKGIQLKLSKKRKKLLERQQKIRQQLNELNATTGNPTGEIVVKLVSNASVPVSIEFSYVVQNAGWNPLYDIRANNLEDPIELIYKANVYQNTGYDWNDVKLTISTGNPMTNNNRPVMRPVYVDFYRPVVAARSYSSYKKEKSAGAPAQMEQLSNMAMDFEEDKAPVYDVTINENLMNAEYEINISQDIPSDGKEHLVEIQTYNLPANYLYHSVPKLSSGAFLLAKIADYGKYNLLSGTANIFFEGMYVGQSFIDMNTTTDSLLVSLGKDEKISVKRVQMNDLTSKKFIGTNTKETKAFEIIARNNKNAPIQLEILDQIPISRNKDIEVEIEEKSNAEYHEDYGKLKWKSNIPPSTTKKLRLVYTIKYPKDKDISVSR